MKRTILIALALLPCLAVSAEAHGRHHHHSHAGHHAWRFHHHHHHGYGHHHRHHGRYGRHAFLHDRSATVPEAHVAVYRMVTRSAIEHGLPPALAHGIVRVESGYNCHAYNAGASGIMQVRPATARSVGVSGGLRSCQRGLEAGMRYLRLAYELAHGDPARAATLYNRGLAARPARSGYSRSVMRMSVL